MKKLVVPFSILSLVFVMVLLFIQGKPDRITSGNDFVPQQEVVSAKAMEAGKVIFTGKGNCVTCHQATGVGVPGVFPPLAKSDFLLADKNRAIQQTIYGSKKPLKVNGMDYPGGIMTLVPLTDQEVVYVVNYVLNNWGNKGGVVTLEEVKAARKK
jgi:nitrite reductase (NO-forming)